MPLVKAVSIHTYYYFHFSRVNIVILQVTSNCRLLLQYSKLSPIKTAQHLNRFTFCSFPLLCASHPMSTASSSKTDDAEALRRHRILSSHLYFDVPSSKVQPKLPQLTFPRISLLLIFFFVRSGSFDILVILQHYFSRDWKTVSTAGFATFKMKFV